MNPRYVRTMVDRLLSDLERNPRIGRPRSWMGRFGRPLGLGLAMGIGSVTGCSGDSSSPLGEPHDAADAVTQKADTLPPTADAYGIVADVAGSDIPNALPEVDAAYGIAPDRAPPADTRDALPIAPDAYGLADLTPRDALPFPHDAYGTTADANDGAPPAADGGIDGGGIDGGIDGVDRG
jgi:hypothetical protein